MDVRVLGPLSVTVDDRELQLGGRQQRLVLALLVSADGRSVSTDQLIDGVWGEHVTSTARKALQGYIHHLREEIGDALKTEAGGYSLETGGDVDAVQFERLHGEASELLELDPNRAAELLREALGIWGGPAYGDLRDELALIPEVARLENLRVVALGDRIDSDLALGRHEELIGELEGLTYEYPFQERFRAQHMTALYRAGRHVEALRSYERMRRFLADETGLEPSVELQGLEERILAQDPTLIIEESAAEGGPAAVRGYELRELIGSTPTTETYRAYQRSVGREVAVRVLGPEIADDPDFIATFRTDTARVAGVEHPHIGFVFDTWREPGRAYQVSRWMSGGNLAHRLAIRGSLGLSAALRTLEQVGGALASVHRAGAVHGRLDATSVLYDESDHAYLAGFLAGVPSGSTSAVADRKALAVLAHEMVSGREPRIVDDVVEPDLDEAEVPSAFASVFAVAFSPDGYGRIEDFLRALRQAAGADVVAAAPGESPRTDIRNPYKGLQAFQEADADDFFGRDDLIAQLLDRLGSSRLIAVVGPSGSGKSSVVKAGLMAELRASSDGTLLITEMYPGAFPFEELEGALLRVGVGRSGVIDDLLGDDRGLVRVLKQILPTDDAQLVLVIDQFEELFSTVTDETARQLFLDNLVNATSDPRSRLRVVLTMRADFFDRPLEYARFGELLKDGLVPVTVPSDEEMALAISQPARSVGVEFEPGLVGQIVHDVASQPGGLPLLQYALTELFKDRASDMLTLAAYQRSGGVLGALGQQAEELYGELSPKDQDAIQQALLRMVTVDEGADDVRRRVRRSELSAPGIDERALDQALQAFGAHRLVTFDRDPITRGPTVEVAHEALLREWDRLTGWVEAQRDDLVIRKRLDAALSEWRQSGEEDSYLPRGGRLAQFEDWAATTTLSLSADERAFLAAGNAAEAERAARAASRRRRLTAGLGAVAVLLGLLAAFALVQSRNANEQAEIAQENERRANARGLAAAATTEQSQDADRALLLALAAANETMATGEGTMPEAVSALHRTIGSHRIALRIPDGGGGALAWSPDGSLLLTASPSGTDNVAMVRSADTGELQLLLAASSPVTGGAWSADGQIIITTHDDGAIILWDPASGLELAALDNGPAASGPTFDPTGQLLAVHQTGTGVRIWDLSTMSEEWFIPTADAYGMDFNADGTLLAITHVDADVASIRDMASGDKVAQLPLGNHPEGVAFAPTGSRLATLDQDATTVWDVEAESPLLSWPSSNVPHVVAWSPDGELIATAGHTREVEVFDADTGNKTLALNGHTEATIRLIAFSGGAAQQLASADDGGVTLVWDLEPAVPLAGRLAIAGNFRRVNYLEGDSFALVGNRAEDSAERLELDPPSRIVDRYPGPIAEILGPWNTYTNERGSIASVLLSRGGTTAIFDPWTMEVLRTIPSVDGHATNNQETMVVVDTFDGGHPAGGEPHVIDIATGDIVSVLSDLEQPRDDLWIAAFSPDGSLVAVGSHNRNFRVHDVATGGILAWLPVSGPDSEAQAVSFSSDGALVAFGEKSGVVKIVGVEPLLAGEPESAWLVREFDGLDGTIQGTKFSPDGTLLAVSGRDTVINFFSTDDWALAFSLDIGNEVYGTDWSADGSELITSVDETGIVLITIAPVDLIELGLDRITRGFTEDECRIHGLDPCPTTLAEARELYGS